MSDRIFSGIEPDVTGCLMQLNKDRLLIEMILQMTIQFFLHVALFVVWKTDRSFWKHPTTVFFGTKQSDLSSWTACPSTHSLPSQRTRMSSCFSMKISNINNLYNVSYLIGPCRGHKYQITDPSSHAV